MPLQILYGICVCLSVWHLQPQALIDPGLDPYGFVRIFNNKVLSNGLNTLKKTNDSNFEQQLTRDVFLFAHI